MRKPQVYSLALVAAVAVGLAACGDDSSDFSARPEKLPDNAVLSIDDLSNCTAKKAGSLEFVKDTPYVCVESGDKFRWEKVSQTEDEPEDFKVCNQGREGQYALASKEDILYTCSDEEWIPVESGDVSSSSGKEANSSSSKPKSSDSGKDVESSGSESSSSAKDASSNSESSSSGKSSSSGPSTSSGTFEQSSSSSVSSSSAASSSGTSSSEVRSSSSIPSSFSVGDDRSVYDAKNNTLTDYRDGQVYRTVTIGEQTWMAENLNFAYLVASDSLDSTSFCYNNDPSRCSKYGRLYIWSAAMDSAAIFSDDSKGCGYGTRCFLTSTVRGACPKDWHLSTQSEWFKLIALVGDESEAGRLLKSTEGWFIDKEGTDAYEFSVLPAGRSSMGVASRVAYTERSSQAYFWTATECGSGNDAYGISFYSADIVMKNYSFFKYEGYSVRCVKDVVPSSSSATPKSSSRMVIESSSSVNQAVVDPSTVVTGTMTDERDGQTYGTVTIGEQTWMAENLKFSYKADPDSRDSSNFCFSHSGDCIKYGRYYTWASAMDSAGVWSSDGKGCGIKELCTPTLPVQGVCPSGWHLPSNYDWQVFLRAVGGSPRKVSVSLYWKSEFGTNEYRFYARPGGLLSGDRTYMFEGSGAYFWSSAGFYLHIDVGNTMFLYQSDGKENVAYNVRCIKD